MSENMFLESMMTNNKVLKIVVDCLKILPDVAISSG
jgi:hypothetical protein